jgi:hypothetical protein
MNPEDLLGQQPPDALDPSMMQEEPPTVVEEVNKPDNSLSEQEERDLIQKALRRFRIASNGMDDHHKRWALIDQFDRGRQWDNVQDVDLVSKLQRAYEHVWDQEKVPMVVRRCVDRSILQGTSIAYVFAEENIRGKYYGEGHPDNQLYRYDVKIKKLNNAQFYIDPSAYNIPEAKFFTITESLSFSEVKNNPTFRQFAGDKLKKLKFADLQRDNDASGDIYDRPVTKSTMTLQSETGDEMCTMHVHWERYRNEEGAWQVDVSYFLWNTDFLLYRIDDFKPSIYPFAVLYDEEEDNSFWGTSTAMDMLENQKIINKTAQAASIIGTLHQNPQKVVQRESGINAAEMSRTGTLAGKVWTSNIPNAVEILTPPDIPKGLFDIEDRMKNDIKDMAGITEAYTGESVGSLTTSTGVDSLIQRSTIRDRDKALQIDQFVEDLSNIIAQFILVYWTEARPIMTRKANGTAEFEQWTPVQPEQCENLEWRVRSDVYAKAPVTAASKSQQADNLMQLQGQFQYDPPLITVEEWIEMKDFPNKADILARMEIDRKNKQAQDQQSLVDQINQIISQAQQIKAQGATDDQVNQQITPMVQQIVQQTFTSGQNQGSAQSMSGASAPQGTTSPNALGNMTQG